MFFFPAPPFPLSISFFRLLMHSLIFSQICIDFSSLSILLISSLFFPSSCSSSFPSSSSFSFCSSFTFFLRLLSAVFPPFLSRSQSFLHHLRLSAQPRLDLFSVLLPLFFYLFACLFHVCQSTSVLPWLFPTLLPFLYFRFSSFSFVTPFACLSFLYMLVILSCLSSLSSVYPSVPLFIFSFPSRHYFLFSCFNFFRCFIRPFLPVLIFFHPSFPNTLL